MTAQEKLLVEDAVFDLRRGQIGEALGVLTALLDRARHDQTGTTTIDTRENRS